MVSVEDGADNSLKVGSWRTAYNMKYSALYQQDFLMCEKPGFAAHAAC